MKQMVTAEGTFRPVPLVVSEAQPPAPVRAVESNFSSTIPKPHAPWFDEATQRQLEADDLTAAQHISRILMTILSCGLVLGVVAVLLAVYA